MQIRWTILLLSLPGFIGGCTPLSTPPKNEPAKNEPAKNEPAKNEPAKPAAVAADEQPQPEHAAALKWARELAEGYLRAAGPDFKSSEALAWASPQFRQRHEKGSTIRYYGFKEFVIANTSMAPNGKEVVFRGTVTATSLGSWSPGSGGGEDPSFRGTIPFTLRVSEDPKEGRWQVDSMQYEEPRQESAGK